MRDYAKEFMKEIRQLHRHSVWRVFADFCELSACSIANSMNRGAVWEAREAQYMAIVKSYTSDEVAIFPKLLALVVEALEFEMQDFLGAVFMELELGNHWKGQYFTPYLISKLMAEMTYSGEIDDKKSDRSFLTLSDPACGAGCMVIAFAEVMRVQGVNYQRHLHVTCVDVDSTAAHMAYIQLALLHIPAIVVIGNSLSLETRDTFYTPAHVMGGWSTRLSARSAAATAELDCADPVVEGSSLQILPSTTTLKPFPCLPGIQISLFD